MYQLQKDKLDNKAVSVLRQQDGASIPFNPANTDYANFKKQILADEAQLQDSEGNVMADAKDYVRTLP